MYKRDAEQGTDQRHMGTAQNREIITNSIPQSRRNPTQNSIPRNGGSTIRLLYYRKIINMRTKGDRGMQHKAQTNDTWAQHRTERT